MTTYRTILADPPWRYNDKLRQDLMIDRSSDDKYDTLTVEEICDFGNTNAYGETMDVAAHLIEDVAFLFLWTTNPFLLDGAPQRVARSWGFEPKQLVPWVKGRLVIDHEYNVDNGAGVNVPRLVLHTGMGHITRGVTEHLLIATRGKYSTFVKSPRNVNGLIVAEENSVLLAGRRKHSRKPDEQYAMIERVAPGPYLELFATQRREGWTSWGNEISEED